MILKIQSALEKLSAPPEGQVRDLLSVARGPDGRNIGVISPCGSQRSDGFGSLRPLPVFYCFYDIRYFCNIGCFYIIF